METPAFWKDVQIRRGVSGDGALLQEKLQTGLSREICSGWKKRVRRGQRVLSLLPWESEVGHLLRPDGKHTWHL